MTAAVGAHPQSRHLGGTIDEIGHVIGNVRNVRTVPSRDW
jgi:hypothetical protein